MSGNHSRHRRIACMAVIILLVGYPGAAWAQFGFLDRIFAKMENLSFSGGPAGIGNDGGLYDNVTPVSLSVRAGIWAGGAGCRNMTPEARAARKCEYDAIRRKQTADNRKRCMLRLTGREEDEAALKVLSLPRQSPADRPSTEECARLLGPIKEAMEEVITTPTSGGGTTTIRLSIKRPEDTDRSVRYAVALGYGQILGLKGERDGLEYKGGIEELPSVGLNVIFFFNRLGFYGGWRLGLNRLLNFRAFAPPTTPGPTGVTYSASSTALYYGGMLGVSLSLAPGVDAFVEGGYTWRNFKSLEWGVSGAAIPAGLVRTLPIKVRSVEGGLRVKL